MHPAQFNDQISRTEEMLDQLVANSVAVTVESEQVMAEVQGNMANMRALIQAL